MTATESSTRTRRGRIGITVFFLLLVLGSLAGTRYFAPRLQRVQSDHAVAMPVWKCLEVPTGDRITVSDGTVTNLVHVRGIASPPTQRGRELDAVCAHLGMREEDVIRKGQLAGKALRTWIYRRKALLAERTENADGTWTAYVAVGGVDVGRKMLQNGQAYALDEGHPRMEGYRADEAEARQREIGIWRR
jgi:endonuclease YncB( thermonuclease family)